MRRQADVALDAARRRSPTLILEVGCGTGWLTAQLAAVAPAVGVDLSPDAIRIARARHPNCTFLCGDVVTLDVPKAGFVVTCDVIAHVPDAKAFVAACARVLGPGDGLMIQTQNPFVWSRSSALTPTGRGQIRQWLTRSEMRGLLRDAFTDVEIRTIYPSGDRGLLALTQHWVTNGILRRIAGGNDGMNRLKERLGLGQELVVTARRR